MKALTKEEEIKISKVLNRIEEECCTGRLNGEFASTEVFNYDNEIIDVELKYGTQDGDTDVVYTEQIKLDRKTLEEC